MKIKKGDKVTVKNWGGIYPSYYKFFEEYKIPREISARYAYGVKSFEINGKDKESIFTVLDIIVNSKYPQIVTYALISKNDESPVYLIQASYLEKESGNLDTFASKHLSNGDLCIIHIDDAIIGCCYCTNGVIVGIDKEFKSQTVSDFYNEKTVINGITINCLHVVIEYKDDE